MGINSNFLYNKYSLKKCKQLLNIKQMKKMAMLLLLLVATVGFAQNPKYVFYFIGDGMGPSHVLGTELYLGELQGEIGRPQKMCFTQFPESAFVTTFSKSNGVTDSAASGTALATGEKTNNGHIGVKPDGTPVYSVAYAAKQAGYAVGVATTVCINHATPGAFYAHQKSRNNYVNIADEMLVAEYDFYAGGDPVYTEDKRAELYKNAESKGYAIARGYDDYKAKSSDAKRMMLYQKEVRTEVPYTIDRTADDITLAQITAAGIDFLKDKSDKGFFMMVEGGKIDYASHADDVATVFHEVMDFNNAIEEALRFYNEHPDETLIVVTADHETGGLVLGMKSNYTLNLKALKAQKKSYQQLSGELAEVSKDKNLTWATAQQMIKDALGLWGEIEVSSSRTAKFKALFEKAMSSEKNREAYIDQLCAEARSYLAEVSAVSWASGNHSGTFVPLFSIGAGSDQFNGVIDNTDVPKIIKRVVGY